MSSETQTVSKDEIASARRKKRRKYHLKRAGAVLIALGVVAVILIIFSILTPTTFKDAADSLKVFFARSHDFPMTLDTGMIIDEAQLKNAEIMITGNSLISISDNGGILQRDSFKMSAPNLSAGDTRAMLFDRGNKEVRIYNRTSLMTVLPIESPIIDAAMSGSGNVAVLTESDGYTAQLEFYSKASYKKTMTWYCAYNFPYAVFLNDNGSRAAVCAMGMDQEGVFTSVYCIDTGKAQELFSVKINGLVISLQYYSNYGLLAFTEDTIYRISSKGDITGSAPLDGIPVIALKERDSSVYAVAFGSNNIPDINYVMIFDQNLQVTGEITDAGAIKDMYLRRNRLYVLGDSVISVYDLSGQLQAKYSVISSTRFIEVFQNSIWAIQSGRIDKVDAGGSKVE